MKPACVFFGTPEFAVPSLESVASVARVVLVVSQPDRPAGRGRKVQPTATRSAASRMGVEVIQPARLRDPTLHSRLRGLEAAFFFVTAYGRILPAEILGIPPAGCVNLHASLLPRHRGGAPIAWAVLCGDTETGLTLMRMDEGLDTGPVIASTRIPILEEESAGELASRLAEASRPFIEDALPRYLSGDLVPVPQPAAGATVARPLTKEDGIIDWSMPAADVARLVRAMTPWPGARTCMGDRVVCVSGVRLPREGEEGPPGGPPGLLLASGGRMRVSCGDGWIEILRIQASGRRCLDAPEFLRGCRAGPGLILRRPP